MHHSNQQNKITDRAPSAWVKIDIAIMNTEDARPVPKSRTLEGWTQPLSAYLIEALEAGLLVVKQGKGYEYLVGEVVNPQGTIISFL